MRIEIDSCHLIISPEDDNEFAVTFERKTDEKATLSVRVHLLNR